MRAIDIAPPWFRGPNARAVFAALDRGDSLLVPPHLSKPITGSTVWVLAEIARKVGAPVILDAPVEQVTTRERVRA